jgi:hypothetical protein
MLQLEDPTNNRGLGWKRLTEEELVDLIYIGVKLARRSHRRDLTDRNASKADAAADIQAARGAPETISDLWTCTAG